MFFFNRRTGLSKPQPTDIELCLEQEMKEF